MQRPGVALSLIEPLPKARLSGAAWWPSARRPIIALSARHKTDDHLWFSLFHEAAHILLHGKKSVFVDGSDNDSNGMEIEANAWAANFLLPRADWRRFTRLGAYTRAAVLQFAEEQGRHSHRELHIVPTSRRDGLRSPTRSIHSAGSGFRS